MDRFRVLLLALLILQHGAVSADDPTELIGVVGGSVTFRSHNPDQIPAFWNFGTIPIVTVIFKDGPQAVFSEEKFQKRFTISEDGHALTLSQLSMEDAGNYSVKIGRKLSIFTLHVYRPLPQPTVTCEAQNCSAGSCLLSLRCSAPGAGLGSVRLGWSRGQRPWAEGAALQLLREPSPEGPEPLTCTARNPVSSSNVTVTDPGGLCNGALSGSQVWVIVGIVSLVVVPVILSALFVIWKFQVWKKCRPSKSDPTNADATPEPMTVYAQVGPSLQGTPNGVKGGSKEDPDTESSRTVYSLVKRPEQAHDGNTENVTPSGLGVV